MEQQVRDEIRRFVRESPGNRRPECGTPYFGEPLVGCAAAGDPLFARYKEIIGPFYLTPQELMATVFGPQA